MQARPDDRQSRQEHRAELAAAVDQAAGDIADAGIHVEGRAVDPVMLGQQTSEDFRLVVFAATPPVPFDLLEGDHVGTGHDLGDAFEIVAAVGAEAVLDVVADEFHDGPAPPQPVPRGSLAGNAAATAERLGQQRRRSRRRLVRRRGTGRRGSRSPAKRGDRHASLHPSRRRCLRCRSRRPGKPPVHSARLRPAGRRVARGRKVHGPRQEATDPVRSLFAAKSLSATATAPAGRRRPRSSASASR